MIIYRATGVINFAQGARLVALGAYLTYAFADTAGLPFALAVLVAVVCSAFFGAGLERTVLRKMVGEPVFAVIMITIGLLFIIEQAITAIWGFDNLNLADVGRRDGPREGDVVLAVRDLWTLGIADRRAGRLLPVLPSLDARRAHARHRLRRRGGAPWGIPARRVFMVSWAISGRPGGARRRHVRLRPGGARRRSARSRWWRSRR